MTAERIAELRTKREVCWSQGHPELIALLDAAEANAALRAEVVRLEDCRQHLQREVADQTGRAIRNRAESNKRWQRIAALEAELVAARAERDAAVNEEREACANYDATLRCDIAPGTSQE